MALARKEIDTAPRRRSSNGSAPDDYALFHHKLSARDGIALGAGSSLVSGAAIPPSTVMRFVRRVDFDGHSQGRAVVFEWMCARNGGRDAADATSLAPSAWRSTERGAAVRRRHVPIVALTDRAATIAERRK